MALEATAEIIGRHVEIHRADRNYDQRHQNACCPTEDPKEQSQTAPNQLPLRLFRLERVAVVDHFG